MQLIERLKYHIGRLLLEATWDKGPNNHVYASNNNALHTGYSDREYSNIDRFLTDLRRERLTKKVKFPVDFSISLIDLKTLNRAQFYIEYPSLNDPAKITVKTMVADIKMRPGITFDQKRHLDGGKDRVSVTYKEKTSNMTATIEKTRDIMVSAIKKLKAAGYIVDNDEVDTIAIATEIIKGNK